MREPSLSARIAFALLLGLGASLLGASCTEEQATACSPGDRVFCRCRGGSAGTKECGADGSGFGSCESFSGDCDELPSDGSGSTSGPSTPPAGGNQPRPNAGELLAPCTSDAECGTGLTCPMGFCTRTCTSYEECAPPEPAGPGDCVELAGAALCVPYCITQEHCEPYGADSRCGFTSLALPAFDVVVCANWGETLQLPPDGYPGGDVPCDDDRYCNLGLAGRERVCGPGGCTDGCHTASDCASAEAMCSSADPSQVGTCGGTPGVPGDDCPGIAVTLSLAQPTSTTTGDTSSLPPPAEAFGEALCAPGLTNSEEVFYAVTAQDAGTLLVLLEPVGSFDPMLYARTGSCQGTQVACEDTIGGGLSEIFELPVSAGTTVWVVVDGYDGGVGSYEITFDLSP